MAGELDADGVRTVTEEEVKLLEESGASAVAIASSRHFVEGIVPWVEGDTNAIEAGARRWVEATATAGMHLYHANALAEWAIALCGLGDLEPALEAIRTSRGIADPSDVADQMLLDLAEAYALALEGQAERALTLLGRARKLGAGTQMSAPAVDPLHIEASVLRTLGDLAGAQRLLESLVERETSSGANAPAIVTAATSTRSTEPPRGSRPTASCRRASDVSAGPFAGKITSTTGPFAGLAQHSSLPATRGEQ